MMLQVFRAHSFGDGSKHAILKTHSPRSLLGRTREVSLCSADLQSYSRSSLCFLDSGKFAGYFGRMFCVLIR